MTVNLLIAPDFAPERFAGWHMLNTMLQKRANLKMHLLTPANADEQSDIIEQGNVDIIYANPFDAAYLIREKGYQAVARPIGKSDEMVIASKADAGINQLEDLKPGCKIAMADNRDVKLIGLRLLEAVDLTDSDIEWHTTENYQAAARELIKGNADAAFFLAEVYHAMTGGQVALAIDDVVGGGISGAGEHQRFNIAVPRVHASAQDEQAHLDWLQALAGKHPQLATNWGLTAQ